MPEKFKRLLARLKRLSEHKRINIELSIEKSEGGVCLPLWMRLKTACAMRRYISAVVPRQNSIWAENGLT
jgi:hypothetical protein